MGLLKIIFELWRLYLKQKIIDKMYKVRQARLAMQSEMNVGSVVNPDPHSFGRLDPDQH